jgi:hypothetical protein
MGPVFAKNISLWGALAHEVGHDITHADKGLLDECAQQVYTGILDAQELKGHTVIYNGITEPFEKRAAEVWKFWISETVADVIGILNFGPASAIAYASLVIPIRNGSLETKGGADDPHPIDALRTLLAADLTQNITSLNSETRNAWSDALLRIVNDYAKIKDKFALGWSNQLTGFRATVEFPFDLMRQTTKIVSEILANGPLKTLENHSLSEINTWADNDEAISVRIADELINKKEPSIESQEDETIVYPTHIVSGAIYSLMESSDIPLITSLATSALNKFYDKHGTWSGHPIMGHDFSLHRIIPSFGKKYKI